MIKRIEITEELKKIWKKEWLIFSKSTVYYWLYKNNILVWISWLIYYKNKVIFKNNLIFKEYRGKWYFWELMKFLLKKTEWIKKEANCNKNSLPIYLKYWFKVYKNFNCVTQVIYE